MTPDGASAFQGFLPQGLFRGRPLLAKYSPASQYVVMKTVAQTESGRPSATTVPQQFPLNRPSLRRTLRHIAPLAVVAGPFRLRATAQICPGMTGLPGMSALPGHQADGAEQKRHAVS